MTRGRILVLGAGGFIGTHVRHALERLEGVDRITLASRRRTTAGHPRESWQPFDATRAGRAELTDLIVGSGTDVVINCAGLTHGDESDLIRADLTFVSDLLATMSAVAPDARLVQLGSSAEYGAVPVGVPIREDVPPNPVGAYGRAKLAASEQVLAVGRRDGADAIVLRVFNPIGPGLPEGTLLARAARSIRDAQIRGDDAITLGSLESFRDFVDIEDVAEAVALAARHAGRLEPRIVNIGSGRATRARDLVTMIAQVAGFEGRVIEESGGSPRSLDVPWQAADISTAAATLGWRPRHDLERSVRATWQWVRDGGTAGGT